MFLCDLALGDASQSPIDKIRRCEEVNRVLPPRQVNVKKHYPSLCRLVPQHRGIAVPARPNALHDGVAAELREVPSIGARGDAWSCGLAGGGVDQHERRLAVLAQPACIFPIHHRAAAADRAHVIWRDSIPDFLPVNEVAADRVSPVHVAMRPTVRVVLVEQVILAIEKDQTVWIVVPAATR